eukprot:TRINITY_DN2979_c0_g2_i1.p1 TRINITY_DN2979_c0_g2~~TRINITY_DN2979_c0_g2_i1.p1  ORF type:complete len:528 (-),score=117.25 TRINITY_DN2979_c0_g2_i1:217-1800(-)
MDKFKKQHTGGPEDLRRSAYLGSEKEKEKAREKETSKDKDKDKSKESLKDKEARDKEREENEKKKKWSFKTISVGTGKWFENTFGKKKGGSKKEDLAHEQLEKETGMTREELAQFTLPRGKKAQTRQIGIENIFAQPEGNANNIESGDSANASQPPSTNTSAPGSPALAPSVTPPVSRQSELQRKDSLSSLKDLIKTESTSESLLASLSAREKRGSLDPTEEQSTADRSSYSYTMEDTPRLKNAIGNCAVIKDYGIKEDLNKKGLRKAKKEVRTTGNGTPLYQMEDTNTYLVPFDKDGNSALFAVFDGHSGKDVSTMVKETFPQQLQKAILSRSEDVKDMKDVFLEAFMETDKIVKAHPEFECQGTTASVAFIWKTATERLLQVANVGDSRVFVWKDGKALQLTEDHKLSNSKEQKRIKEQGIALLDSQTRISGLSVTRALGDQFAKEVDSGLVGTPFCCSPISLPDHSPATLIVASDGLWDVLSANKSFEIIRQCSTAQEASDLLVRTALQSSACQDNITVMVIFL